MYIDENGNMPRWLSITLKCVTAAEIAAVCADTVGAATVAIGVGVALGATLTGDIIDDGEINYGIDAYLGAAAGGAIGALGGGFFSIALSSGLGNGVQGIFDGSVTNMSDFAGQFSLSVVTGGISYGLSTGITKIAAAAKLNKIVGNWCKSNKKINDILKNNGLENAKIGKDGISGVFEKFYKKRKYNVISDILSNACDFTTGVIF